MARVAYGINITPLFSETRPKNATDLQGLKWARFVFKRSAAKFPDLTTAFSHYDPFIDTYNEAGVHCLLILNQETYWGNGPWQHGNWPAYADGFATEIRHIAEHYRGKDVAYEIWNEGDTKGKSSIYVAPKDFAHLLQKTAATIKSVDPSAPVVLGGLASGTESAIRYIQDVCQELSGTLPVDAIGIHPYGHWPPSGEPAIPTGWFAPLESALARYQEKLGDKPIWITEIGVSEEVGIGFEHWPKVADFMQETLELIQEHYAEAIPVVIWFAWSDQMRGAGIVDTNGFPKQPIYDRFFQVVRPTAEREAPMLQGKGAFIWQVQKCEGGNPAKIVQVARDAGLSHVAVKIADGAYSFPDAPYDTTTIATIEALKNAGFTVWGWHFIYGRNRHNTAERIAAAEAQMAIQRVQTLGLSGFIVDFENTGNPDFTYYGDADDARVYMRLLRANLPGIPLAAASHRFPRYHPNLPWEEFMQFCDLAMPQVYWVGGDPAGNLRASWEEYQILWPHLTYVPLGAAYSEGGWSASPNEITAFLQEVRRLDLPAVTFWSWQHARNDAENSAWPHTELWDAMATFDWPGGGQPEPISEHPLWVIASDGLKFRREPVNNDVYWIDGIVFPIGTNLTGIGNPTAPDGQDYRFQKVRSAQGQEGWVTFSIGNEMFLTSRPLIPPPPAGSPQRTVKVSASLGLKFRSQALVDDTFWINNVVFPPDTLLTAIGDPTEADPQNYRWQYVQTATGQTGWVTYSIYGEIYLQDWENPTLLPVPPEDSGRRVVQVTASLGLKFRSQTSTDDTYWVNSTVFLPGQTLIAIANPTESDPQGYRWQYVQTSDGRKGWVAYSIDAEVYLRDVGHTPNTTVWSTARLNVREMPSVQSRRLWTVADEIPLTVLEDPQTACAKVGMPGQWLRVRTPSLREGYVAAQYVHNGQTSDPRSPIAQTPPGESPYIFGIHDPFDRGLFANSSKTGWMLITEQVGANPATACGHRTMYYDWSRAGFGVIARLNHGYHGDGTLPLRAAYSQFAEACARWVEGSIDPLDPQHGCHVWIIGNEMNNPREWPGNHEGVGGEPITPEAYAACFNAAYAAIKAVQPGAIVCPGAVDPYNAVAGDPKDWFTEMLSRITALDGIVLHAYTHGPTPNLITSTDTFQDDPLTWQYYNFYAYRTLMDLIPGQWRTVPVFITETDQVDMWHNANDGWVREAYSEIHRWNQSPHHQQIRCLLLYRWQWDQWALEHKHSVLDDFKQTLQSEYRWRSSAGTMEHFMFGVPVIEAGPSIAGVAFSVPEIVAAPDDFKRIWGIGPKIEAVLRAVGIQSFAQLAVLQPAQIKAWLADVNIRGRAIETWPQQAQLLAEGSA